ncbi:transcriptional regulator, TetR family [Roseovarius tolerans]|uniref:Transcriptional regulator, TetR family n=1 Tax=Roseovarius tolerans TaxID=74031 RepID=A0A1H7VQ45_9RHOB|nr:TetR/AcrR family transcriptional regulator [Roseovarius tolerans]SEM11366.1 transcriptional regulator, TetR family [Roseovarius tolerans]
MPWEKSYDDATVLEAAMTAFWAHGYQGTSMADLVSATGVNRSSLYAGFGNKRDLFLRALRHYDDTYRTGFLEQLLHERSPTDAILAAFDVAAEGNSQMPGGCLMINSAMELAPHDPEVAAMVDASMGKVETFFTECLAQRDTPPIDTIGTAKVLQGLLIGLMVVRRANKDSPSIPAILAQVRSLVG